MIRSLFMAVLALCLALPAMMPALAAAPHCAPPESAMAMPGEHHGQHRGQPAPSRQGHDCIGCAVPARAATPFAATPFYPRARQRWSNAATPPATAAQPDTPPPRA